MAEKKWNWYISTGHHLDDRHDANLHLRVDLPVRSSDMTKYAPWFWRYVEWAKKETHYLSTK